jgi:hypothetical protein
MPLSNISDISWQQMLVVEEVRVPGDVREIAQRHIR